MPSLSRRSFVRGVATVPLGMWLAGKVHAQAPYVRYDIATPQGQDMLRVFAGAVQKMKALGDRNATGWRWQWYTHFVSGATTKTSEISRIFGSATSTQRTLANDMWNTCQSHAGQDPNHFLPWHRIFVLYFEQIVREVSGRPDFALPYWNYTASDVAKRGVVPAQFRMSGSSTFAPLYRSDRSSLANSGQPIHKYDPGDAMDVSAAMASQHYSPVGSVQGFCRAVDSGIHGRIHVLTGTSKNMGKISYAAQDPLFWVHHANIDRLWASWNLNGGVNPTSGSWRDRVFVFADRTGQRVTARLRDFFSTDALGYRYDRYVGANGLELSIASASGFAAAPRPIGRTAERIGTGRPVELGARPARSLLSLEPGRPATALDPSGERRTYLVIKDLHAWAQPEVLYHIYLAPRGGRPEPSAYVGNINFFDAEFHDHGQSPLDEALGENFYSFDVTQLLTRLAAGRVAGPLEVTLVPGGRPAQDARPLVGAVALVWQ